MHAVAAGVGGRGGGGEVEEKVCAFFAAFAGSREVCGSCVVCGCAAGYGAVAGRRGARG